MILTKKQLQFVVKCKGYRCEKCKLNNVITETGSCTDAAVETALHYMAKAEKWRGIAINALDLCEEVIETIENICGETPQTGRFRDMLNAYEQAKEAENK